MICSCLYYTDTESMGIKGESVGRSKKQGKLGRIAQRGKKTWVRLSKWRKLAVFLAISL